VAKPEGVRIRRKDGTETPVELVHMGDLAGADTWGVPESYQFNMHTEQLLVDVFPGHTAIEFMGTDTLLRSRARL
jgi:hypothetical protein